MRFDSVGTGTSPTVPSATTRRVARAVDRSGLLNRLEVKTRAGSNPALAALESIIAGKGTQVVEA